MNTVKKALIFIMTVALLNGGMMGRIWISASPSESYPELGLDCRSALLMEASTGKILYENNADEALPPASVTKVMTLLLVMEAIESKKIALSDMVSASENACSMGGSQIYLEVGEQMSVDDLLKSVVIASANDAAVALAEHVAGTEEAFVDMMNKKAEALGMSNTHFENTNGLDDTTQNHLTSAKDIAIMSRELIKHPKITEYSGIWMDSIRGGEFGLTNTNRLIRFYNGATGLKTGSTTKAGFCITATAQRDGMTLIAVIMGADSRDSRNAAAVKLLNYGFSTFRVYRNDKITEQSIRVVRGVKNRCAVKEGEFSVAIAKEQLQSVEKKIELTDAVTAPVAAGQQVGRVEYMIGDTKIGEAGIFACETIEEVGFIDIFVRLLSKMTLK